ncbi:MAG: carbohydrate kinase [Lachnospiraceae bacterium]|jgi:fructokinase|nr:carbohydrate kinase [Lachnospiraceae bacterium]
MNRYDVVALGELLIDFTEDGRSAQGNPLFEANPGGAPCNVLAMLSKLGGKTAFIGKVGKDFFGEQLKCAITEVGINADNLLMDEEIHTTLALVHTYPDGDRDFSFYRNPGADMMLREEELNNDLLKNTRIFHFGTLSMTDAEVRKATKKAVEIAKENGALISFDPNLRLPLWKSLEEAKEHTAYGLSQCDVLKISDNEIQWFTGEKEFDAGIEKLRRAYPIPLILLSLGKEGSRAYYKELRIEVKSFLQENTIETTGAGDTFCACCLYHVLKYGIGEFDKQKLAEMLTFANAAASIVTTRKGALRVMPAKEEVEALVHKSVLNVNSSSISS